MAKWPLSLCSEESPGQSATLGNGSLSGAGGSMLCLTKSSELSRKVLS